MTRYEFFRKRIAPIAFLLVVGLIAYDACDKEERTRATIVLDYGAAEPQVRAIEAELWMNDAKIVGFTHQVTLEGGRIGKTKREISVPANDGELRIDVELQGGVRKHVVRAVHIEEGATITVPLERDLR